MHCTDLVGCAKADLQVLPVGEKLTVHYVKYSGGLFQLDTFSRGAFATLCPQQSIFQQVVMSPAL